MGSVRCLGLTIALLLSPLEPTANAQSQAEKTGAGGVVAGQDATSLITNPLVIGTAVAAVIGIALAVATAGDTAVVTVTTVSTATTTSQ